MKKLENVVARVKPRALLDDSELKNNDKKKIESQAALVFTELKKN